MRLTGKEMRHPVRASRQTLRYLTMHQIMNETTIKGNWNELKGKLKASYAELTDDDVNYDEGQYDQLVGRLQQKLGKTEDEVRKILADL